MDSGWRDLPVHHGDAPDLLVSRDGRPVWPVATAAERSLLEDTVRAAGACLCEAGHQPAELSPGPPTVVAVGRDAAAAAKLYAHLTGRGFAIVPDSGALDTIADPEVVVTMTEHLQGDLLELVTQLAPAAGCAGLIAADDAAALRRQALHRAAAVRLAWRGPLEPWLELYPTLNRGVLTHGGSQILGGEAGTRAIRAALERPAEVKVLASHGDGIDAFLGPNLILCPMEEPAPHGGGRRPYCVETSQCYRRGVPLVEALASGALVSPEHLESKLLVLAICFGVLPADGHVDSRWSLLHRLLTASRIPAVIAPWGPFFLRPATLEPLLTALAAGRPAGEAVATLRSSRNAADAGLRPVLFGDPRLRPRPIDWPTGHPVLSADFEAETPADLAGAAFLRAYLRSAVQQSDGDRAAAGGRALELVEVYEHQGQSGHDPERGVDAVGPRLRQAVLEFVVRRSIVTSHGWLPLVALRRPVGSDPCPTCSRSTRRFTCRLRTPGTGERHIRLCPACGITEDQPEPGRSSLAMTPTGEVRLREVEPGGPWQAVLSLESQFVDDRLVLPWPAGADGRPLASLDVPAPAPPGPLKVAFVMVDRASLTVLASAGRAAA